MCCGRKSYAIMRSIRAGDSIHYLNLIMIEWIIWVCAWNIANRIAAKLSYGVINAAYDWAIFPGLDSLIY
ncbi:hypothetical protein BW39_04216 [Delftia sp. RIT313]|nr:hypothetical protein BW39_04216 [Delftia sp. RIT313]